MDQQQGNYINGPARPYSAYTDAIAASQGVLSTLATLRRQLDEGFSKRVFDPQLYRHLMRSAQDIDTTLRSFELSMESVYKGYGGYFYSPQEGLKGVIRYGYR